MGLTKLLQSINHIKITKKLMVMYVVGGLIPILMVSIYLTSNTRNILLERALEEATTNTSRVEERLVEVFEIATDISDGLYIDAQLERIITTTYTDELSVIKDLNQYTRIDDYLKLYSEIEGIRIYVNNPTLLDDSQIIKVQSQHIETDWYQAALASDGRRIFMYRYDDIARSYYLSLLRLIKNDQGKELGVLVVNISNRYLGKIIEAESYEMALVLGDERIVLASDQYLEGKYIEDTLDMGAINELGNGINDYRSDKGKYKVLVDSFLNTSKMNRFKLITLLPVEALVEVANESAKNSGIMIIFSLLVSIIFIYIFSKAFSDRINQFRQDMHRVATGDFSVTSNLKGKDELGHLSEDLNIMVISIQQLIHEVYEVRLQKEQLGNKQREAEFKMLASQINPHFLYNSLETIRMKAHMSGQKEIAEVVKKLAKIMRRNLSIKNDEVPLSAELELVRHYLEIQQFRFGDKVNFEFDVKCDVDHYMILPLLLQPLVENAFVHGLEQKVGKGTIGVRLWEEHPYLIIEVSDDGNGIPIERLSMILQSLMEDVSSIDGSIGLMNVNQRVKIFYGEHYYLTVDSIEGQGTWVRLYLPEYRNKVINTEQGNDIETI